MTQPEAPAPTPAAGRLPPPPKWVRNLVVGLIGTAIVLGWIGDMFWGSLVDRHPLGLILLNAKPRYLLLDEQRARSRSATTWSAPCGSCGRSRSCG